MWQVVGSIPRGGYLFAPTEAKWQEAECHHGLCGLIVSYHSGARKDATDSTNQTDFTKLGSFLNNNGNDA